MRASTSSSFSLSQPPAGAPPPVVHPLARALASLVFALGLLTVSGGDAQAQARVGGSLGVTYVSSGLGHGSLWTGILPGGFHHPGAGSFFDVSLGVEIASVGLGPRVSPRHRYRHDHRYNPRKRYRYGAWSPCRGAYWDAWYGYRPLCEPVWIPIDPYWSSYYAWGWHPLHRRWVEPMPVWVARPGVSLNVHLSFGDFRGRHVYVDPRPRWVVHSVPRSARSPAPAIAAGGWMAGSGTAFKEDPGRSVNTARTAVRRGSVRSSGVSPDGGAASISTGRAVDRSAGGRVSSAPRRDAPQAGGVSEGSSTGGAPDVRQPAARRGAATPGPDVRSSRPSVGATPTPETRRRTGDPSPPANARAGEPDRAEPVRTPVRSWYAPVQPPSGRSDDAGSGRGTEPDRRTPQVRDGGGSSSRPSADASPGRVGSTGSGTVRPDRRSDPAQPQARSGSPRGGATVVAPSRGRPEAEASSTRTRRTAEPPSPQRRTTPQTRTPQTRQAPEPRAAPRTRSAPQTRAEPRPRATSPQTPQARSPETRTPRAATPSRGGGRTVAPAPSRTSGSPGGARARGGG